MGLWTDLIDPATLTGYVRESLADIEARRGSLARYLPNRTVPDVQVRFVAGQAGLVVEAEFRAYDAEPTVGKKPSGKRTILELPPIGQIIPVSEYDQLRTRGASDETILNEILGTGRRVAQAIADRMERLRGVVLRTGVATIPEIGAADSFGRSGSHTVTASALWSSATSVSRLTDLQTWCDTYEATNGVAPGVILMPRRVLRVMAQGDEFKTSLVGGGSRPATAADVNAIVEGAGLPPIEVYTRRTASGLVLPDNELLLLPAPVDPDEWEGTQLGASFWGQTLSSTAEDWGIELADQPGIVTGVYRHETPPMIAEVHGDAIGMPVLANADLSFKATVLS
ncbi:major capsid protein [Cellulomonas palmilytica]|uniref:major capsid protein n=1 Tax=Cellulomonas palmilytica TaxID=2608402 RepID=UPI001F2B66F2|nr:major capsid protein [Cellulomonas palmilytica]UJP39333.1 major capsid protein [Cellulomonas palmilytica]